MKKIFFLDDDPVRWQQFCGLILKYVSDKCDITRILSANEHAHFEPPYDMIFLDHDLGGRQMEEHEDCGVTFLKLILDRLRDHPCTIVLHSYNAPAAVKMKTLIADLPVQIMIAPFGGGDFVSMVKRIDRL